ncbi:MAG TPA: pseudouridine synthase [Cellvibrionaceae bacterium]|nr:pseudouridine synthase [Cellvibrionaceae bacterium]HMW71633.1 pseudouridine synthase [Cellvibrionaceae bacterium]HMY41387.1 pseudouridine synthase [Marinagarivorans sp.]
MYQVLVDTDDFVVVDKAAGVPVHGPSPQPTLIEQLRADFENPALNLVHRLDNGTSGLVLIAKNPTANRLLAQLFAERAVCKRYLAISPLKPSKKQGWVIGDMVKVRDGNWMLKHSRDNPARTYFISAALKPNCRLFVLAPQTGKTHQLRVALRSQQAAILGDERYGTVGADRLYLHSWQLRFHFQGQDHEFMAWPTRGELFQDEGLRNLAMELAGRLPQGI